MTKFTLFGITKDGRCIRLAEEDVAGKTIYHLPKVAEFESIEARMPDQSEGQPTEEKRPVSRDKRTPKSRVHRSLRKAENPPPTVSEAEKLTPEERTRRVAELHGTGVSNRQISKRLGVSERTVRRDLAIAVKPICH